MPDDCQLRTEVRHLYGCIFGTHRARHDVEDTTRGRMRVNHPLVGELNLDWDAYPMPGAPGPVLIVYTAEPGGPDHERLQLLTSLLDAPGTTTAAAWPT